MSKKNKDVESSSVSLITKDDTTSFEQKFVLSQTDLVDFVINKEISTLQQELESAQERLQKCKISIRAHRERIRTVMLTAAKKRYSKVIKALNYSEPEFELLPVGRNFETQHIIARMIFDITEEEHWRGMHHYRDGNDDKNTLKLSKGYLLFMKEPSTKQISFYSFQPEESLYQTLKDTRQLLDDEVTSAQKTVESVNKRIEATKQHSPLIKNKLIEHHLGKTNDGKQLLDMLNSIDIKMLK